MNQKTPGQQPKNNQLLIIGLILAVSGVGLGLINPLLYLLSVLGLVLVFLSYRQPGIPQEMDHSDLQARVTQLEEEVALIDEEYKHQQEDYEQKKEENRQQLKILKQEISQIQNDYQEAFKLFEGSENQLWEQEKTLDESKNSLQAQMVTLENMKEQLKITAEELHAYPDEIKDIHIKEEESRLQEIQEQIDRLNERKETVLGQYEAEDLYDLTRLENNIQAMKKKLADSRADLQKKTEDQEAIQKQAEDKISDVLNKLSVFEAVDNLEAAQALVNQLDNKREELSHLQVQAQTEKANQSDLEKSYSLDELKEQQSDIEKLLEDVALTSDTTEELENKLDQINDRLHESDKEISKTETGVIERYRDKANVSQIESEMAHYQDKERKWQEVYDDLERAEKYLEEAFEEMQSDFSPIVNEKTSKNFSQLTGGKYSEVKVTKDFAVSIEDHETQDLQLWEYMSTGTIDQIYLSLRLAISEIIAEEEGQLPLFLDDVFAQYDDERAKNGLTMLAALSKQAGDHQILLFTCHRRIAEGGAEIDGVRVNQQLIENQ